jgi:hypothetical protein
MGIHLKFQVPFSMYSEVTIHTVLSEPSSNLLKTKNYLEAIKYNVFKPISQQYGNSESSGHNPNMYAYMAKIQIFSTVDITTFRTI